METEHKKFLNSLFLVALTKRIIIGKIFVFNYKCNPNVEMYFLSYLGRVTIGVGPSASLKLISREQKIQTTSFCP